MLSPPTVPLPPNTFEMWLTSLPPLLEQPHVIWLLLHHVLTLFSKASETSIITKSQSCFLLWSSLTSDTIWSIDHQSTSFKMSPLLSVTCSTLSFSSQNLTLYLFLLPSFLPQMLVFPSNHWGPLFLIPWWLVTSLHILLAATQMACKSLILALTPIPSFGC